MKYENNYTNEINDVIKNTKLTDSDSLILTNCLRTIRNKDLLSVFKDMYKLYLNDYSMIELSKIYNRSPRTIQWIFKNLGLNRDRFQAQKIASKKRDYVKIRKTFKETMLNRYAENQVLGSKVEEYSRIQVSLILNQLLPNGEVIVGINTMTKVGELDIPIVIFYGDKLYKFGIEIDGLFFHNRIERKNADSAKDYRLEKIGYKIFGLDTKAYFNDKDYVSTIKYENELKNKLVYICNIIKNTIRIDCVQK